MCLQFHFTGQEPATLWKVGLEFVVIETLPVLLYKSHNFIDGLEHVVCM